MKKSVFTIIIFAVTLISCNSGRKDHSAYNFGFENTMLSKSFPDRWFQWGSGYVVRIDSITKHHGKNSVVIRPTFKRNGDSFGCIASKIPAVFEAEEIEVRAYMKLDDVADAPVGLILRIDGASDTLEFDNMNQKKIMGTSDWKLYSVKLPYPPGAKTIYIGALLSGNGQLWVDDFELLIDGVRIEKVRQSEPKEFKAWNDTEFDQGSKIGPFNVTAEKINDLKILGMVWGFLKYYHPAVAAGKYNWDYELFRILPRIIKAANPAERDKIMSVWIRKLGSFKTAKENAEKEIETKISPDLDWITSSDLSSELVSELLKVKKARRTGENYYINLNENVGNPFFINEKTYPQAGYPDAGIRLLSLYRYWNNIQYWFPYRNLIEEDWKNVLKEFIPKFVNASDDVQYRLALLELIGRVHDTHANIGGQDASLRRYLGANYAPYEIAFIENKPVVTGYIGQALGKKSGLLRGDIIESVNNKTIEDIISRNLKYFPASNYPTQLRDIARSLLRTNDTIIDVVINRNEKHELKTISAFPAGRINISRRSNRRDTCFRLISPEIAYIYPGTIKNSYLPVIMEKTINTKGLIIDLRCYPSEFIVFTLGRYLMPQSTPFVTFSIGAIETPGLFKLKKNLSVGEKNDNYYKGMVVILINETSQSQAEYTAMALSVAPGAIVIGSTTAGADGNVSSFSLPGRINTMISGIGVYYPDGRETQRIGIIPDLEVKPTIEGIRKNKDELLEKAIEIIKKK